MGLKLSIAALSIPIRVSNNVLQVLSPAGETMICEYRLPFKGITLNSDVDYSNPLMPDVWFKVDVEINDAEYEKKIPGVLVYNSHNQLVLFTKNYFVYSIIELEPLEIFKDIRILRFGSILYTPARAKVPRTYQMFLTCFTTSDIAFLSFAGGAQYFYLRITDKNKRRVYELCENQTVSYPSWEWQSFGLIEIETGEHLDCIAFENSQRFAPSEIPLFHSFSENYLCHAYRMAPGAPLKFIDKNIKCEDRLLEEDGTRDTLVKIYQDVSGLPRTSGLDPTTLDPATHYNLLMWMENDHMLMASTRLGDDMLCAVRLGGKMFSSPIVSPTESIYAMNSEYSSISMLDRMYVGTYDAYNMFKSDAEKVIVPAPYATIGSRARIPYLHEDFVKDYPHFKTKREFRDNIRKEEFLYEFCCKCEYR